MANKLIPVVKKALVQKYGFKNVSVKNGQGTAWGWVEVRITKPEVYTNPEIYDLRLEAETIAIKAVKDAGMSFYTYCSDDVMSSNNICLLIQIN